MDTIIDRPIKAGDLVNTPNGPGLVVGFANERVLVAPTGQDPPYSTRVGYCEAWLPECLVRRGWREAPETNP